MRNESSTIRRTIAVTEHQILSIKRLGGENLNARLAPLRRQATLLCAMRAKARGKVAIGNAPKDLEAFWIQIFAESKQAAQVAA